MLVFPKVLACDASGNPHDWLSWKDAVTLKVKGAIQSEITGSAVLARGGISRMSGVQSKVDVGSIVFLRGVFNKKEKVTLSNHNLFRRDLNRCGYCGRYFREDKLTRDHIIPTSRGGKDSWKNVITACKSCNNYKDDLLLSEIASNPAMYPMTLQFQPYVPVHSEELVLRNKHILQDQMEFLATFLPEHSRLHAILDMFGYEEKEEVEESC